MTTQAVIKKALRLDHIRLGQITPSSVSRAAAGGVRCFTVPALHAMTPQELIAMARVARAQPGVAGRPA